MFVQDREEALELRNPSATATRDLNLRLRHRAYDDTAVLSDAEHVIARLPTTALGITDSVDRWASAPDLVALVSAFGGAYPEQEALHSRLEWLEEFSQRWDFRAGRERNLVVTPTFGPEVTTAVLRAARTLGLVGPLPIRGGRYDHVLILGGLVRACLARPLAAARLLVDGTVSADAVTALGGFRELAGDEPDLAGRLIGQLLHDEYEAMDAGVRSAFQLGAPRTDRGESSDLVGGAWHVREYAAASGLSVKVIAAPSSEPGTRRANTPDTYRWFADEIAHLRPQQRLLLVTSDIYVPYQHADALRMFALPYGVEVETAGILPGEVDGRLAQKFLPHNYLQEIRSAIRAFRALLAAAKGA